MFEFLPRADKDTPVAQKPLLQMHRENREEAEAVQRRKEQTTVWDGIGAAQVKGGIGFIDRFVTELGFEPEPGFQIGDDARKRWEAKGIRPEQWELFSRATSSEHLEYLEYIALQNQQADEDLAQFGVAGQIALGMTDPVATGLDLATGGLGYAAKAGRLANAVRSGLQAAGTSAALSVATSQYDPEQTLEDGVKSAALSFALGGALGARKGSAFVEDDISPEAVQRVLRDENLSAAKVDRLAPDPTPGVMPIRNETDWEQAFMDEAIANRAIMPSYARIRRDLAARMGKAKSEVVREAGRLLFRDGVGYTDRDIAVKESAGEFAQRHRAILETAWRAGANAAYSKYRQRNRIWPYNFKARQRFNEEVGRAVRGATDVSPEAVEAATAVRQSFRDALKLAQESGLEGFDNIADNPNFMPRYFSAKGFQRLFGEKGLDEKSVIDGLIKPAMRKAWEANLAKDAGGEIVEELDDELLDAVAKAWLKRAQQNFEGDGMDLMVRPLSMEQVDEIARMLEEAGVPPVRSHELLAKLDRKAYDGGKHARAKRRIDMDETFTAVLRNEAGEDVQVSITDLLENDVDVVMTRYIREITGWAALASKGDIRTKAQLQQFRNLVVNAARKAGDDVNAVKRMLDIGEAQVFGRSTEVDPNSTISRWGRRLRNWNFARVMNQVGFSMFAELGTSMAHAGLMNYARSAAHFRDFIRRAKDGKLENKEAQIMERLFAPGTDYIRNPPFLRLDGDELIAPETGGKLANALDNSLNVATHVTSVMSGMAPMNAVLQRVAGRATLLRLLDMANAKKLSKAEIARLRNWGMSEADQNALFAYLRGKRRIEQIDPDALPWETRERLSAFMYRVTRHQVLEADASDSIELMHTVAGRVLLQFRTFMFNSYTRHFLNSAHHWDDWHTWAMLTFSTSAAAMGWTARTYINTVGDPEQREKLLGEENFWKNLVANGIAQSSWSSVIPMVSETVWSEILGNEPLFSNNRSTGLQNGILGIPSVDLALKAYGTAGIIRAMINEDEYVTEKQMRDFWKIWWFSNMTGVRNIIDAEINDRFPDRKDGTGNDD